MSFAAQYVDFADLYYKDDFTVEDDECKAVLEEETATEVITMFKDKLAELTEFTAENIQPIFKQIMKDFKANKGIKLGGKSVYMPIRIALKIFVLYLSVTLLPKVYLKFSYVILVCMLFGFTA